MPFCRLSYFCSLAQIDFLPARTVDHFSGSYGGLISSRISNQTYADVHKRLEILIHAKKTNPNLKVLVSSVVMRIPSYAAVIFHVPHAEVTQNCFFLVLQV